jgi:ATPase family associated with various cellular activities (AAA)
MTTGRADTPPETTFQRALRAAGTTFQVGGVPVDASPRASALLRSRLIAAADAFRDEYGKRGDPPLAFSVSNHAVAASGPKASRASGGINGDRTSASDSIGSAAADPDAISIEDRASYFEPVDPRYDFSFLVLPQETMDRLLLAVDLLEVRELVFDRWNLRAIEPHPSSAINLHGSPGTGKTLAAHAIASRLKRKIIQAKYSQLESKYHGEGPKNLDALFHAARQHNAVLFLDEADALMSQRFETTSQGSEHAVNAMRSELVMSLDRYEGLVIFATNFVRSYDTAFDSRVRHIEFPDPDAAAREVIWRNHLPAELPLAADVSVTDLAAIDKVTGRDIRRAVIDAATSAALGGRDEVTQHDLRHAIEQIKTFRIDRNKPTLVEPGSPLEQAITEAAGKALPPAEEGDAPGPAADGRP